MRSDLKLILEQLTDPNNDENIVLENDRGEVKYFSQTALIPITTPSEEFEDEMVDHNFALMHPVDANGKEIGDLIVFDFVEDEDGNVSISIVDDPYVIRNLTTIYRQRGKKGELALEDDEASMEEENEECESIFGGILTGESKIADPVFDDDGEKSIEELEEELRTDISPKKEKKEKKSFFAKLFGKK